MTRSPLPSSSPLILVSLESTERPGWQMLLSKPFPTQTWTIPLTVLQLSHIKYSQRVLPISVFKIKIKRPAHSFYVCANEAEARSWGNEQKNLLICNWSDFLLKSWNMNQKKIFTLFQIPRLYFWYFFMDCRINMLRTSLSLSSSINSNSGILGIHQKNFLFPRYILF